jgi:phospho-N-acetylmuramoyl-pentapeptide-transferase
MPYWIKIQYKLFPNGQPIRNDGPQSHLSKQGTPTFGGVLIIFAIFVNTIFWTSNFSKFNYILLLTLILFGLIGFYDDYQKVKSDKGISTTNKFIFQIILTIFYTLL